MSIFKRRRGYWPMGERFAAFFRGPTIPADRVTLRVKPTPDPRVSPTGRTLDEPRFSAPFQSREYLLEEAAWLGRQMETARLEARKKDCAIGGNFAELEARVMAWINQGPSAQHRAECDCAQFYGDPCKWPACGGAFKMPDAKPSKAGVTVVTGPVAEAAHREYWARQEIQPIPFKEPSPELMSTLRDIEGAREEFWKMSGADNLNTLKGIGEMPPDYFNTEKPT